MERGAENDAQMYKMVLNAIAHALQQGHEWGVCSTKTAQPRFIIGGEDEREHGVRHDQQYVVGVVVQGVGELRHAVLLRPLRYSSLSSSSLTTTIIHPEHAQTRKRQVLRVHLPNQQFHLATIVSPHHRLLQHSRRSAQPPLSVHAHRAVLCRHILQRRRQ